MKNLLFCPFKRKFRYLHGCEWVNVPVRFFEPGPGYDERGTQPLLAGLNHETTYPSANRRTSGELAS
jgi:hypothetical protein